MNATLGNMLELPKDEGVDASMVMIGLNLILTVGQWVLKIKDRLQSNEAKMNSMERQLNRLKSKSDSASGGS